MDENRCPECEAVIEVEECDECLIHSALIPRRKMVAMARKLATHCIRGHEFTPENTKEHMKKDRLIPTRQCRICISEREKKQRLSRIGKPRKRR